MFSRICRPALLPALAIEASLFLISHDANAQKPTCNNYSDNNNICFNASAETTGAVGIVGESSAGIGVSGQDTSSGVGVNGSSATGTGIFGSSDAVTSPPSGYYGVYGYTPKSSGFGVVGSVTDLAPSLNATINQAA